MVSKRYFSRSVYLICKAVGRGLNGFHTCPIQQHYRSSLKKSGLPLSSFQALNKCSGTLPSRSLVSLLQHGMHAPASGPLHRFPLPGMPFPQIGGTGCLLSLRSLLSCHLSLTWPSIKKLQPHPLHCRPPSVLYFLPRTHHHLTNFIFYLCFLSCSITPNQNIDSVMAETTNFCSEL